MVPNPMETIAPLSNTTADALNWDIEALTGLSH